MLPMALAGAALVMMAVASLASATHVRPNGASPMRISFVPAYKNCPVGSATMTHGTPLAAPSCVPAQESGSLTTGTPDANGAPAKMNAFGKLNVVLGTPNDVDIDVTINDVRCQAGTLAASCGSANAAGTPPDYGDADVLLDDLQATAKIRITDHDNGTPGPGGTAPGTVIDLPFPVSIDCAATADTTVGGDCNISTSANTVVPGSVKTGKRGIVEIGQFVVNDGGDDADIATNPTTPPTPATNTVFLRQGIFIP